MTAQGGRNWHGVSTEPWQDTQRRPAVTNRLLHIPAGGGGCQHPRNGILAGPRGSDNSLPPTTSPKVAESLGGSPSLSPCFPQGVWRNKDAEQPHRGPDITWLARGPHTKLTMKSRAQILLSPVTLLFHGRSHVGTAPVPLTTDSSTHPWQDRAVFAHLSP